MRHWTDIDFSAYVHDADVLGGRMRYIDIGEGPALLFAHGLGCCWQWWLEIIPALARDHRVVAVDLPGFGHSTPLPPPAEMATHADALLALATHLGIEEFTLAGHSMGGLVALAAAQQAPERVRSLIMVNAGGVPMSAERLERVVGTIRLIHRYLLRPGFLRAIARRPRLRRIALNGALADVDKMSGELASVVVPLMDAPGFVEAVIAAGRAVEATAPENVQCPVLLLWGEKDPILPMRLAHDMQARLRQPTLVSFPGCGHSPHVERPTEVIEAIAAFVPATVAA